MNKTEYVEMVNSLYNKLEEIEQEIKDITHKVAAVIHILDELPTEPNEIEDDKEERDV